MHSVQLVIGIFEFVLLIFSLTVHECAHAWTASRLGDQTARMQGRVTLNPTYHIDPVGTLLIPALGIFGPFIGLGFMGGLLIGWAKPTPIISRNFHKIRRDENLVTLAGPASNLLLALAALAVLIGISLAIPGAHDVVLSTFAGGIGAGMQSNLQAIILLATLAIYVNLSLFLFNLLPVPPLDGSHLMRNILPYNAVQVYDRIPFWVSWILMIFVGGFILRLLLGPMLTVFYVVLKAV